MDPAAAFSIAGQFAIAGWVALLLALFIPRLRSYLWPLAQFAIPAILAAGYVLLLWEGRAGFDRGGFGSIAQVRTLFAVDGALAAGWLHYLAFDLFIGAWLSRDGIARQVPLLLILPCLPLTFLFGPAGLLLYLLVRAVLGASREEALP